MTPLKPFSGPTMSTVAVWLFFACAAAAQTIWAVGDGEKIERDDLSSPLKRGNSVWDGHKIKLFGARNEMIAFQLIVEANTAEVKQFRAALPALTHQNKRSRIVYTPPAANPTNYVGRPAMQSQAREFVSAALDEPRGR